VRIIPVPAVQKEHLVTRARLLHPYQPLAVRAKSKSSLITRQIIAFAAIEQESMPMISVKGPEPDQVTPIFLLPGILLQPQLPIGGFEDGSVRNQFEATSGAGRAGGRHGGDAKQQHYRYGA